MRKFIDLEIYKSEIIFRYEYGTGALKLSNWLREQYGLIISEDSVRSRLKQWGIAIRTSGLSNRINRRSKLMPDHLSILNGLLLGDGCLHIHTGGHNAHFNNKTIQQPYAEHLVSSLPLDFRMPLQEVPEHDTVISGVRCHCKTQYVVESRTDLSLTPLYHKWYPTGRKIVPEDLVLDPLTVVYWFYGDGTTSYRHDRNNVVLCFQTDCFTFAECEILAEKFRMIDSALVFTPWINRKGHPWLRTFRPTAVNMFFEYINSVFTQTCFSYKWKLPETK